MPHPPLIVWILAVMAPVAVALLFVIEFRIVRRARDGDRRQ
jgi:hypothetical protein